VLANQRLTRGIWVGVNDSQSEADTWHLGGFRMWYGGMDDYLTF
jgi:hypothetical protein